MPTNGTGVYKIPLPGAVSLRLNVSSKICEWTGNSQMTDGDYSHLKQLIDAEHYPGTSQREMELMRALNGPHGYTVYKMLLIKRGMKPL